MAGLSHRRSPTAYVNMRLPQVYKEERKKESKSKLNPPPQIVLSIAWGKSQTATINVCLLPEEGGGGQEGQPGDIHPIDFS